MVCCGATRSQVRKGALGRWWSWDWWSKQKAVQGVCDGVTVVGVAKRSEVTRQTAHGCLWRYADRGVAGSSEPGPADIR